MNRKIIDEVLQESMTVAKTKPNVLLIACDDIEKQNSNKNVGLVIGDAANLAYGIYRMMEKDATFYEIVRASLEAYNKSELEKSKN